MKTIVVAFIAAGGTAKVDACFLYLSRVCEHCENDDLSKSNVCTVYLMAFIDTSDRYVASSAFGKRTCLPATITNSQMPGAEVPVIEAGDDARCDGDPYSFVVNNVPLGLALTGKFIPVDPDANHAIKAANLLHQWYNNNSNEIKIYGGNLETFENTSPEGRMGRPPGDPFDPRDRGGTEWTADLIPSAPRMGLLRRASEVQFLVR